MGHRTNLREAATEGGKPPRESCACRDCHPVHARRDTFREGHLPAPLAIVHLQNHAGRRWRVADGLVHQQKVRSHLQNRNRKSIDQQTHLDPGGMPALT